MTPETVYDYDTTLLTAITISNVYNYAEKFNIAYFFKYMEDNQIDYSVIDAYCNMIDSMLTEMIHKDYDLQYTTPEIDDSGRIIPHRQQETVITLEILKICEELTTRDVQNFSEQSLDELIFSLQQISVNGMKFQLKYALETLYRIRTESFIWQTLGLDSYEDEDEDED